MQQRNFVQRRNFVWMGHRWGLGRASNYYDDQETVAVELTAEEAAEYDAIFAAAERHIWQICGSPGGGCVYGSCGDTSNTTREEAEQEAEKYRARGYTAYVVQTTTYPVNDRNMYLSTEHAFARRRLLAAAADRGGYRRAR